MSGKKVSGKIDRRRVNQTLTGPIERPLLALLCRRTPAWVTSDMLTWLGLLGAVLCCLGYWLSRAGAAWLWLAVFGLFLNWLGDSLDGSLARFRGQERPGYGFFFDHMVDTAAIGLIAVGIGLSPYARIESGLAVLLAYYLMVILSMVTCIATGVFRISFGGLGPTEIRLTIMVCTICAAQTTPPVFDVFGEVVSIYDVIIAVVVVVLGLAWAGQAIHTGARLAQDDPPRR